MKATSLLAASICATLAWAIPAKGAEELAAAPAPEASAQEFKPRPKLRDDKLNKHIIDNIDIFGKSDLPAIYILVPNMEELEGMLLTRDFSRDPYFMQNIDREEFEMKVALRDFDDSKFKDRDKDEETARR